MIRIHEGSSLYYSLLWTDPAARERFVSRLNLIQALNGTLDDVQEPQVAERKIHWWHEELQRMFDGQARHPATQACQINLTRTPALTAESESAVNDHAPMLSACLDILSSVSTSRFTPPKDDTEADARLTRNHVAQLALLSHALSEHDDDLHQDSHSDIAALALAKHGQLSKLPYLLHRGHPVFSDEMYQRHKTKPADLAQHVRVAQPADAADQTGSGQLKGIPVVQASAGKEHLIASVLSDAHATLRNAIDDEKTTRRYRRPPLLPIWRLLVLREKQAALWLKTKPDMLRQRTTLTPLKKFFIAWRNRR